MIKREEKKQMILHAATECFSQLGYDKTTLDDIGGKVKLNKASLYYYYNSKEDLFCDVIYAEAQRFREEIRNKTRALRSAEEKVIFFLTERSRFYKRLKHLQEITMNMMKKIEPIFYTLQQGIQQEEKNMLKEMLDEGIHTGEINRTDPSRLSEVLLKVSSAFKMNGADTEQSDNNTIEDIRFTTRLILRGVKG
ncbi:MAG: TetR/AcrR family transcriptional regulator [Bacteroidia bacterium]|jgi:AcrR family transcriptional regulator|nr:TetR/AcrR family transcriptional regulator [Bacteroidia bacterium]